MTVVRLYKFHNKKKSEGVFDIDGIMHKLECTIQEPGNQTYKVLVKIGKRMRTIVCHMAYVSCVTIV